MHRSLGQKFRNYSIMHVKSFAKINLGIEILRKRNDGFHDIRTLFQTIDLWDDLEFKSILQDEILLDGRNFSIPWDEKNLVYQAANLLKKRYGVKKGIEIQVKKKVPAGRGLGGGSSNAAMTLYALSQIWRLGLDKKTLKQLGACLGADVPFFFEGGLCRGEGKGDRVFALEDIDQHLCLLVFPDISVSTGSVYGRVGPALTSENKDSKIIKFLDSRDLRYLENDLEEIVFRIYPQIKAIKGLIQEQGSELSMMSGSGSAVYGLFLDMEKAQKSKKKLQGKHPVVLVKTLTREQYWRSIQTGV
jgi:4-diphosphocytidyl-2-C-methyl-D-erythritol kinase